MAGTITTSTHLGSPDQLFREFVRRANAGDIDGLLALYAPEARVYFSPDNAAHGHDEIRIALAPMLASGATFRDTGQRKTIVVGTLALTSATVGDTRFTTNVAEQQADGSWLWLIDHPSFTSPDYLAAEQDQDQDHGESSALSPWLR